MGHGDSSDRGVANAGRCLHIDKVGRTRCL